MNQSTPASESPRPAVNWPNNPFWRIMAVALVAALFYIGAGLRAQSVAPDRGGHFFGSEPSYGRTGPLALFENAAFADNGQLAHIRGDVDAVVTTIDDGETLLLWVFGPEVSGVPQLDRVVRYNAGSYD